MISCPIYDKNGVVKNAVIDTLELHDEWMAECYVTVSVKSPVPIDFEIGDYILYRGEQYTIQYSPNLLKKATSGSYQEGFVYDNIKFVGSQDDVVRCDFNDIVLNDNEMHYTALSTFPFYCESVDDLLDRIQANLEDLYPGQWIIIGLNTVRNYQRGTAVGRVSAFDEAYRTYIDPTGTAKTDPYGKQGVAESVDNITCWDAMKKVHDDFDLNFIVRGRVIIVGTAGVFTANTFRYGKGNGLYEIERVGDSDQQIVTRLRAYGSETNLPSHYYATLNKQVYATVTTIKNKFGTTGADFLLDLAFDRKYFTYRSESYPGTTEAPNYIIEMMANDVTVRGYVTKDSQTGKCYVYCESVAGDDDRDEPDAEKMAAFVQALTENDRLDFVDYVNKDTFGDGHYDYSSDNLPDNMAVSRLMLPGFPNQSLDSWVQAHKNLTGFEWLAQAVADGFTFSTDKYRPYIDSPNISQYGVRPASIYFDGSDETDDIHPTIDGMEHDNAPVDEVYAADQVEDNGVYPAGDEVKNINITLPDLGFELDKVYEDGASIDMKNGMCGARSFKIAKKPTKDANNRWVCNVERVHDESLDLWFPYCDFQIHGSSEQGREHGDKYVLTGITMPDAYIEFAAVKLLRASIEALKKNHAPRYTYQPRIDEIFMQRQHDTAISSQGVVSLHDTLKAGDIFSFADDDLNIDANIIIDVLTIKENGNNGIPTYEVTLRDEKQVGTIQKITNKVESIISGATSINGATGGLSVQQVRSIINNFGGSQFLSKLNDDTAQGFITMLKGLQVGNQFVSGLLGEGGVLRMDADGKTYLEADKMYIRMRAYFDTVEVREYKHSAGNRVASPAGAKCVRVAWFNSSNEELEQVQENLSSVAYFRCFFRASDNEDTVRNNFVVGDQVYCHITTVNGADDNPSTKGLNQKHYWRLCIGKNTDDNLTEKGEGWIDISNRSTESIGVNNYTGYQTNSDVPEPQDSMVQLGNVNDTTRQGAIIEFVTGADAPSYQIYQGINSFSLTGRNMITIGYNSATGKAELKVYGDAFIGDPNRTTYIEYVQDDGTEAHTPVLNIKAKIQTLPNSTYEGKTASQFVQDNQIKYDSAIQNLTNVTNDLQSQIDGEIVSWFYEGTPTLDNAPAVDWDTDTLKERHLGDMYYDVGTGVTSGFAYRFIKSEQGVYDWQYIDDTAITLALAKAAEALGLAGSKAKTYTTANNVLPSAPYNVGDLWLNATGTWGSGANVVTWENEILKCINACPVGGTPNISDWTKASKYTDDSAFNGYINAFLNGSGASGDSATAAAIQKAIASALGSGIVVDGGLLLTSLIGMRQLNDGGDPSDINDYTTWAGISGEYDANVKGGGIAAWYGGGMVDHEVNTTATDYAKSLFRFDGSGYMAGGNITWDAQGRVAIKDITTLIAGSDTNILNALTTFNNAFHFNTQQGSSTILSISPQAGFDSLSILENGTLKPVATQEWANGQFVTKTFFDNIFRLYNGTTKVNVNDTIPSSNDLNIEAMFGFWTKKYISALGQGDDGSTSYSTLAALNDVTLTNPTANQILKYDGTHWVNAAAPTTYVLPTATDNALGGIKVGYTTSGKNYAIQLDANSKAYVNVPWENTTYSLPLAASGTRGGIQLGYTQSGRNYPVQLSGEKAYVNVPWENTVYTLPQATTSALGGIKVGYDGTTAKTYAIALDNNGRAYVNVPWTDTTYDLSGYATTSQLNALEYFNQITGGSCAFILKTNKDREYVVDLTHEHSWFDLVDTPTTLGGFGLKDEVQQLIADYTAKKYVSIDWLNRVLRAYNNTTQVAPNDLTTTIDNLKLMVGTWTEQYLTALGRGSDSGGGGQGDVTWALLAQQATNNRTIHQSYIADILSSYATTSWVTGLNYATQTWVEGKGYATTTQLNALEFLSAVTGGDGVVTLTTNKNNKTILDLSHEHSFLELLDRPTTVAGYGITDAVKSIMIGTKSYTSTDGIITLPTYYIATDSRAANTVLAAPNGASGAATFRALVAADIPTLTKSKISDFPTTWDWSNITNKPTAWAWTAITGKPTTIAGYGITDAKIVDGVITLGAVNITPITSVAMTVPSGFSISGSPISKAGTLALSYASGYEGFTTELKNKINSLYSWFEVDSSGNVKTKDYTENGTTKHRGFYSPSFVSALGQGDDGQSGVGDVTWELLEEPATNNRSIHLSYISSALASYLTSNSYIQLSAISDMATKTWVGQQGYLKQASLSNYYTKSEVYTKTEVNALARVKAISVSNDGLTFTWQDNSTTIADFSHEHSFLELLDRPSTIAGYGISLTADDIPNLPWGKITSGKPTTISGYGITDAVTSVKIGTNSYTPASGIVTLPAYPTNYYSNTDSHTANTVLAAPNGSSGVATFRSLVAADIPTLTKSKISDFPTSWAWSALTGVPTTLAGYGITDAKIVGGVITLGANTITPITSVAMTVPTGFSVSGSPISKTGTLAVSYASGYEGFTTTLKDKINLLYSLFTREGSGTSSDPYVIKANYGLYTEKFLSALGQGDDGQSGVGDVTWELLAKQATNNRSIHSSYISSTLAAYATQSWVSNQNYATQTWVTGKNYATQSWVSGLGYATQSWVTSQGYATTSSITTAINALTYFNAATVVDGYGFKLSGHGVEDVYIDLTHEHSWFELLDRPSTLTGLGVAVAASDIPNLDWSKITTGKPTTLAGYGITDAVASISINGTSYLPSNKVVTLPVYTSTQVDALARLKTLALTNDGVITFTHQDNSTSVVDFSHEHSFLELVDRPTTIKGYGITILESDVPNLPWSKITSGKPTTVAGYGITDAITTGNIGSQSVSYATTAGGVSWANVSSKPSAAGNGTTPVYWTGSGFTACTPYSGASVNYANSAGSASQLSTPRTLWGQSFNGTGNVSGNLSSVGHLSFGADNTYDVGASVTRARSGYFGTYLLCDAIEIGHTNEINTTSGVLYLQYRSPATNLVLCYNGGNVGVGNSSPSYRLDVSGVIYSNTGVYSAGYVTALSDARHKTIVRNTNISVEQIAAMRSVVYRWSDRRDNSLHVGSIAQDWQGVLPQVVSVADDKEHTLGLQYGVAALVAAITTARKVVEHEERIKALERENADLKQAYSFIKNAYEELKLKIA